jgi:hypothetical protein
MLSNLYVERDNCQASICTSDANMSFKRTLLYPQISRTSHGFCCRRAIQCDLSVRVITVVLMLILAQDKSHLPHFTFTSQLDDRALAFLNSNHAF